MKLKDLIEALQDMLDADEFRADAEVTYGPDFEPIEGGLIGKREGLVVVNLAPVSFSGQPHRF